MSTLYTMGYEATRIDEFIERLTQLGIDVLIDVRQVPISRKRGFSKTKLAEQLRDAGIDYVHLRDLGDPKPGREAARRGDYREFRRIFSDQLRTKGAKTALIEAALIARQRRACLLCFERCHEHCHRAIVADLVSREAGLTVKHALVN